MILRIWQIILLVFVIGIAGYAAHYFDFVPKGVLTGKGILLEQNWYLSVFYGHVFFGMIGLVTGVTQFYKKLRNKHLQLHRNLGKTYVISSLLSAICGFMLAFHAQEGWAAGTSFAIMANLWFAFTVLAWRSIRKKDIYQHRIWMLRSYAMCCTAISLRLWLGVFTGIAGWGFGDAYIPAAWLCWTLNLVIIEFYIYQDGRARSILQKSKMTPV